MGCSTALVHTSSFIAASKKRLRRYAMVLLASSFHLVQPMDAISGTLSLTVQNEDQPQRMGHTDRAPPLDVLELMGR